MMIEEDERDWDTVRRLENWRQCYGPKWSTSSWGRPPFLALESTLLLEFGHEDEEKGEDGEPVAPVKKAPPRVIDSLDADKVNRAFRSPFLTKADRRLILAFYLAQPREWEKFGRLCRKAGTTCRHGQRDLFRAERRFGDILRRFTDKTIKQNV